MSCIVSTLVRVASTIPVPLALIRAGLKSTRYSPPVQSVFSSYRYLRTVLKDFPSLQDTALRANGDNDWHVQPDGSVHPEGRSVKGAVLDFSTMVGRQLSITYEEPQYRSWMLRK